MSIPGKMGRTDFIKKIVDAFQIDVNLEKTPYAIGSTFVPVIPLIIPPTLVYLTPSETDASNGITVPSGKKWKILSCLVRWVSDVNVGNREIILEVVQNANDFQSFKIASRNFQAASKTVLYSFFIGAGDPVGSAGAGFQSLPLPQDMYIQTGGFIFIFDETGVAAGDTANIQLLIEESDVITDEFVTR